MRAIRLRSASGPAGLELDELETPTPGTGEALVRVHAAAVTRDELDWPVDRLPATPSYEFSGVVAALGAGADVQVGEEVFALSGFDRDGAAAEFVLLPASVLAPKPRSLGHLECAAIPLAALSAWQGLFDHGRLGEGQRVLVHGAAGGVGGFAVQLARTVGATVIGTASAAGLGAVRAMGADQVVDHRGARFEGVIEPVDLVFDTVGGERLDRSPAVVRPGGRIVSVAEEPPTGSGVESVYFVVEPSREQLIEIAELVDAGKVRVTIDTVFPLTEAKAAFERAQGVHGPGKIVLQVVPES
jgi:NADPH:quinone reductase-like Zn-dependent oxidoreductase